MSGRGRPEPFASGDSLDVCVMSLVLLMFVQENGGLALRTYTFDFGITTASTSSGSHGATTAVGGLDRLTTTRRISP